MKKIMLIASVCMLSLSVMAEECNYTREQEIVRSAENFEEIQMLGDNFDPNMVYPCGGTLGQLAVLRGNLSTLNYLKEHGADFSKNVPLKGYEIPEAPSEIPFPLFIARYSPNSEVVDSMINSGMNFRVTDSLGHNVFWYLDKNPVLRNTYLTKKGWDSLLPIAEIIRRIQAGGTY